MAAGHDGGAMARRRMAAPIEALRRYWAGRNAILLLSRFDDAAVISGELTAVGATLAAAVTAGPLAHETVPGLDSGRVWYCAGQGDELSRDEFDDWLSAPPAAFVSWLDRLDPERQWVVLGTPFTRLSEVAGRAVHGWRREAWAAWEDKTRIDRLWASAGVPSPRHVVASITDPCLPSRAAELDSGFGVVLARDCTRGITGGATGLRWVRSRQELDSALRWLRRNTNQLRIAEFVPGVPCSVLGLVVGNGVAVFDPIEIVTLRDQVYGRLVFCGSSTWWRPSADAAGQIRRCALLAGRELVSATGYRGLFSVDGVLSDRGFLATELNPRDATGLGLAAGWPQFPLYLFQRAAQEAFSGVFDTGWHDVETAFRTAIRQAPSLSVLLPAAAQGETGIRVTEAVTVAVPQPIRQELRYRLTPGIVELLSAAPPLPGAELGPATAALSRIAGPVCLSSFQDCPPCSSLGPDAGRE